MISWLSEIKVVLFDLDGTLYQDDSFMDRYIQYTLMGIASEEEIDDAVRTARLILEDAHFLRLGHFYHLGEDKVLRLENDQWIQGWTWEGDELDAFDLQRYGSVSDLAGELVAVGDPWMVASVFSRRYKSSSDVMMKTFDRVRKEMLSEPHGFACHAGLLGSLAKLTAVDRKILLTNTHEPSGIEFVEHMGISDVFEERLFLAGKPDGMERRVKALLDEGYTANQILSIGDNPWNDLFPVKQLGGRTCHIAPYHNVNDGMSDIRLSSLDELEELLTAIQTSQDKGGTTNGAN